MAQFAALFDELSRAKDDRRVGILRTIGVELDKLRVAVDAVGGQIDASAAKTLDAAKALVTANQSGQGVVAQGTVPKADGRKTNTWAQSAHGGVAHQFVVNGKVVGAFTAAGDFLTAGPVVSTVGGAFVKRGASLWRYADKADTGALRVVLPHRSGAGSGQDEIAMEWRENGACFVGGLRSVETGASLGTAALADGVHDLGSGSTTGPLQWVLGGNVVAELTTDTLKVAGEVRTGLSAGQIGGAK